ncbi:pyruvate dehydrogenase complex dihydrolipoamide acetyltransferase [Enterovirga sp.]|uniref:pyruvate dehydrogenase complex dihydrolipoamide acetyltransferase n=1 Tax=Enterovirga sp. TaxID=2026350 RepID=UPI002B685A62|nr:pyruvate dehydrogenase complex dihydrolipoamide acetyltransferase [Enterovirga sp.]HMO30414.1 pyruvate dehydrogenase complex dihydrolipoamide acetyltransferase [Enterovirga sp.]
MPTNILMPALSPTMEKGNLAKWLKKEIETNKATMEVEAVDEGVLAKITVPEGTADVPVNQVIGIIAGEGEDPKSVAASGASAAPVPKAEAPAPASAPAAPAPKPNGVGAPAAHAGDRVFASPLARRIAKESGVDLASIAGSGPKGRIVQADVKAAVEGGAAKPAATAAPAPAAAKAPPSAAAGAALAQGPSLAQVKAMYEEGSYEEVPLDGMRKTVAKRLTESKQTVPHFYLSLDVELDALLKLRTQLNASAPQDKDGKPLFKLSVNDFVIKALALALQEVPDANAVWAEDRVLKFRHSDVGVAVAIEGGLFTPVIRRAEQKTLSAISGEMKDLAGRARKRRLKPEEYQGGATAVSNLGMYGISNFQAVINPPHATILAVGAGEKRVVVKNDAPAVVQAMTVTLSLDHRVVDGALGAEVLSAFKRLIENPMSMLV